VDDVEKLTRLVINWSKLPGKDKTYAIPEKMFNKIFREMYARKPLDTDTIRFLEAPEVVVRAT